MSDKDQPKPNEPHSGTLPAVDPWEASDPLVVGPGGLPATADPLVTGGVPVASDEQSGSLASGTPAVDAATPAPARRSRLVRLSVLALAGGLLIGLLVAGLPLLTGGAEDGGGKQLDNAGDQAGWTPPSVPAAVPGSPSGSAKPSPTPTPTKKSRPTPQADPTTSPAVTKSVSPKADAPPAHSGALVNGDSGTCLTGGGAGVQLTLQTCNKSLYQRWTFRSDSTIRAGNLCMSLAGGATANLTKVTMAACDGSPGQRFRLNTADDLVNRHADKCVDAYDGQTADGTPLVLWTCLGQSNQSWYLR
ncbi:ricin-type beta-trefoil lectin domain protein [Micromonospora sp. DT233]|uniref:ricin-type beta-trefoil lectin domain protein n=1 Tax=Micromonospora sp. DT233 TaxID=3393432 RepID=UPI003CEFB67C